MEVKIYAVFFKQINYRIILSEEKGYIIITIIISKVHKKP